MSKSRKHFEEFQAHTRHKHLILRNYFSAWGHKLGLRPGAGHALLYVDACAGRGADDLGNQGSPLIAAEAAATAQENIAGRRNTAFSVHVIAIERDGAHASALRQLLAPYTPNTRVVEGTLADIQAALDAEFDGTPALFFIDPFGLEPLEAAVVQRALTGPRREALLLFSDVAALRHLGAITSKETKAERRHKEAIKPLPLLPELPAANEAELAVAATESRAQLEATRKNAIRIMNSVFGDESWLSQLEGARGEDRRASVLRLYLERLRAWGAEFILPIPVVDSSGMRAYTLIHASKSPKAYTTMKEAVSHALAHSPLSPEVVAKMRELVSCDVAGIEAKVRAHFSGQTVRWAEDPTRPAGPCVRNFVLESTPMYPFDVAVLKTRLQTLRVPGRVVMYVFPET